MIPLEIVVLIILFCTVGLIRAIVYVSEREPELNIRHLKKLQAANKKKAITDKIDRIESGIKTALSKNKSHYTTYIPIDMLEIIVNKMHKRGFVVDVDCAEGIAEVVISGWEVTNET